MRASEVLTGFRFYQVKVKIKAAGFTQIVDTTITAKTPYMARRLAREQFGAHAIVGDIKELK